MSLGNIGYRGFFYAQRGAKTNMTCKEAEKLIPIFIKDELNYRELDKFIHHIEECEDCMEEMSIQFLVAEGIARLEDGGNLELDKQLKNLLSVSKRRVANHKRFWRIILGVEFGCAILMVVFLFVFFILP